MKYLNMLFLHICPGFGQDRVNFHQNPGRGTAGTGWPHLAKQSRAFHTMCHHAGFRWGGSWVAGTHSRLGSVQQRGSGRAVLWVVRFVLCFLHICIVVVPVRFVSCSVKLPLSRPTGFCLFLSILLRTLVGGGAAAWRFRYRLQPNPEHKFMMQFTWNI